MYKARYFKADGKKGKARALPESTFDGVVHESVMHQVVKAHLSNQRQGTAAAKGRSDVKGGSAKPWRQKGTGRARAGTIRAAQWEGGGVAFPPMPHSWRIKVPKKVKALAHRSALNVRAEGDRVVLAELPVMEAPKTSALAGFVGSIGVEGKVLILTAGMNPNVYLSSRNLQNVMVREFGSESVYDVLWAHTVVIDAAALAEAKPAKKKAAAKKKKAAAPVAEAAEEEAASEEAVVVEETTAEAEVAEADAPEAEAETEETDDA